MKIKINIKKRQKGFTLIEAMIAIVVFSFGLLGVAGVMTVAVKSNHNGYMRSQATFLATSMADMMRANTASVKAGNYNVANISGYNNITTACRTASCNPTQLTRRDLQLWSNMFTQLLPNSTGTIQCSAHVGLGIHPYSGMCNISVSWTESNTANAASAQTLTIAVKP